MKAVLRAMLMLDACVVLVFALFFLATPWFASYSAVAGFASSPALIGQLLGVVLLGFAWLQASAAVRGALTVPVGRITGHTLWVCGAVVLVWQIVFRQPQVVGVALAGPIVGVALLLLGLVQMRLAGMVRAQTRRQEKGDTSRSPMSDTASARRPAPNVPPLHASDAVGVPAGTQAYSAAGRGADPALRPVQQGGAVHEDPSQSTRVTPPPF